MIGFLRGRVLLRGDDHILLLVGDIGFRVYVSNATLAALGEGEVELYTYLHVREDGMALYGFPSRQEFSTFELLLTVSGVGPKVALGVLSTMSPEEFHRVVAYEDVKSLTRVPGVGPKMAKRLIFELKDRVGELRVGPGETSTTTPELKGPVEEALQALEALGYRKTEAAGALERVLAEGGEVGEPGELVRAALKILGTHS